MLHAGSSPAAPQTNHAVIEVGLANAAVVRLGLFGIAVKTRWTPVNGRCGGVTAGRDRHLGAW